MTGRIELYDIIYKTKNVEQEKNVSCTEYSLEMRVEEIKKLGGEVVEVVKRKQNKAKHKIVSDKQRYYNSMYRNLFRQLNKGEISNTAFDEEVKILKSFKESSKDKQDFKNLYEAHKKTLTKGNVNV